LLRNEADDLAVSWSSRWSLTARILAVNIIALALLTGGFFYLDSFRVRVLDQRSTMVVNQTLLTAVGLNRAVPNTQRDLLRQAGSATGQRFRIYAADGSLLMDSWRLGSPTYELRDPASEAWERHVARFLDRMVDHVVDAERYPPFIEPPIDRVPAWPEALTALKDKRLVSTVRRAPDRTPMISAAIPLSQPA